MDFGFTPEEEAFREEVREFLKKEVTEEVIKEANSGMGYGPYTWQFLHKLGERRWLAPNWPWEYGGMNASYIQRFIIQEEMSFYHSPTGAAGTVGSGMAGPVILEYGTEEQKREYLPRIARGEIEFALGYTEPQAGSDMAALEIRAEDKGDYFLLNGQKLYNTRTHYSQYHWLGARTDKPKHRGISLFIVDLKTPGITINALQCMHERTNEVFYDNVQVPRSCLVGEKNKGWTYLQDALARERSFPSGTLRYLLEELMAFAKETTRNGKPMSQDPIVRQRLAELAIEVKIAYLLSARVAWMYDRGMNVPYESSMLKLFASELKTYITQTGMRLLGFYGPLKEDSKWVRLQGDIERETRSTPILTIAAGSSEILRNVIALRGLGLPREPRR
jgi:hypothetical protein